MPKEEVSASLAVDLRRIDQLDIDGLHAELSHLANIKAETKIIEDHIAGVLDGRYADRAKQLRAADGKDFGQVSIRDNGFVIRADLPKKVEYDQAKLQHAVDVVESWNQDPREFVSLEIKVSETKYNAWPTAIRSVFEPARTVKPGKPTYKVEVDKGA